MQEIKTTINIDGNTVAFKGLILSQSINEHHRFKVTTIIDAIEDKLAHTPDVSKTWLGKKIMITHGESSFLGVVTNVGMCRQYDGHGYIDISGSSNTYLLESAEYMYSWTEKTLKNIVQEVVDRAGITAEITPEYQGTIDYECQYIETDFTFIKRLAKQYHEWLYYDGEKLIFGKPIKPASVSLEYGTTLSNLELGLTTLARPSNSFSYNSYNVETLNSTTPNTPSGLDEFGQAAFNASMKMFSQEGNQFITARAKNKKELDDDIKRTQESQAAESHFITASSECPDLTIGSIVDIKSSILVLKKSTVNQPIGSFAITEINHIMEDGNHYENNFKAISSNIPTLPAPNVPMPVAQTQMATVVDNNDPKQKGRVQLQMLWQTGDMKTSWIRVLSPSAGCSDNVATNRGFVFIPEVNDQVLVGFRYNNPNRPFVMGSLYNGTTGAGGDSNNKIKSITTRSGCTITFDDDEGEGKITVSDPSGSSVTLNGDKTISISAPDSISINSKEININAEESVTINGEKSVDVNSKDITNTTDNNFTINSNKKIVENATAKEENYTKYNLEAKTVDLNGTLLTNIKGGTVNLN